MQINKDRFELYLNLLYIPNVGECLHFTEKTEDNPKPISRVKLVIALEKKKYGTLMRKHDPVKFNEEYEKWKNKYSNDKKI